MELSTCDAVGNIRQGKTGLCTQALLTLQLLTLVGYLACFLLGLHHVERVTGRRRTVQTEDDGRLRRSRTFDALVTLVEHGFDAAP